MEKLCNKCEIIKSDIKSVCNKIKEFKAMLNEIPVDFTITPVVENLTAKFAIKARLIPNSILDNMTYKICVDNEPISEMLGLNDTFVTAAKAFESEKLSVHTYVLGKHIKTFKLKFLTDTKGFFESEVNNE